MSISFYKKIYDDLIAKRFINKLSKEQQYCEKHHIIPRCMGGDDSDSNLIFLTPREHYIAHLLLAKIYYTTKYREKLLCAVIMMRSHNSNQYRTTRFNSRVYESIRKQFSDAKYGWFSRLPPEIQKMLRKKTSDRLKGGHLSEEHKKKIGNSCRGNKMPDSQRASTSKRMKEKMASKRKQVRCIETGIVYESIKDAEKALPNSPCISACCRGITISSGGLHFEFADNELRRRYSPKAKQPSSVYGDHCRRKIYCLELDRVFDGAKECAIELSRLGYRSEKNKYLREWTIRSIINGKVNSLPTKLHLSYI